MKNLETLSAATQQELRDKGQWPYGKRDRAYQTIGGQPGIRDMEHRFAVMKLPASFKGETVIDIGCNVGAVCLEAKRRGAKRVVGIDYREETIIVAKKIAKEYSLDVEYYTFNVDDGIELLKTVIGAEKFDHVFALSIWEHVDSNELAQMINFYAGNVCWFEGHASSAYGKESDVLSALNYSDCEFLGQTTDRNPRLNFKISFASELE